MVKHEKHYLRPHGKVHINMISQVDTGYRWYYHYICLLPLKMHENVIMRKTSGKFHWRTFHKTAN